MSNFRFCKDERSKVKEEHKEFKASEVTKELGRRWQEVDSVTKQKYENMVAKDKQRYDKVDSIVSIFSISHFF
jgi:HMG (high mobility group) box